MILTGKEIYHIQFVLPVQGNLLTLATAAQILDKLNIEEEDQHSEKTREIDLTLEEFDFLREMITYLDKTKKLSIQGLSLYNKILNKKE